MEENDWGNTLISFGSWFLVFTGTKPVKMIRGMNTKW